MVPSSLYVWDSALNGGVGGFVPLESAGGSAYVTSGVLGSQVTPRNDADSANQTFLEFGTVPSSVGFIRAVINPSTPGAAATALHTGVGAQHILPGEVAAIRANDDITSIYMIAFGPDSVTAGTGIVGFDDTEATVTSNMVHWRFTGASDDVRNVIAGMANDRLGLFVEGYKS